jgi:hypothetical protein
MLLIQKGNTGKILGESLSGLLLLFIPLVSRGCYGSGGSCCDWAWDDDGNVSFKFRYCNGYNRGYSDE